MRRYEDTEYCTVTVKLKDVKFKVNVKIGPLGKYQYTLIDRTKLIPTQKSFDPITFFE